MQNHFTNNLALILSENFAQVKERKRKKNQLVSCSNRYPSFVITISDRCVVVPQNIKSRASSRFLRCAPLFPKEKGTIPGIRGNQHRRRIVERTTETERVVPMLIDVVVVVWTVLKKASRVDISLGYKWTRYVDTVQRVSFPRTEAFLYTPSRYTKLSLPLTVCIRM